MSQNSNRDFIVLSQMNNIYPMGTLPSNNFFKRIRPNPYYVSNELRNIKNDLLKNPIIYSADTDVIGKKSMILKENSFKNLIGTYIDTCKNINSILYNYEIESNVKVNDDNKLNKYIEIGYNLFNKPLPFEFIENKVKYTRKENGETSSCPPCSKEWKVGFNGEVIVKGKDRMNHSQTIIFDISTATRKECGLSTLEFRVEGARLFLKMKVDLKIESVESKINLQIIEEKRTDLLMMNNNV